MECVECRAKVIEKVHMYGRIFCSVDCWSVWKTKNPNATPLSFINKQRDSAV